MLLLLFFFKNELHYILSLKNRSNVIKLMKFFVLFFFWRGEGVGMSLLEPPGSAHAYGLYLLVIRDHPHVEVNTRLLNSALAV